MTGLLESQSFQSLADVLRTRTDAVVARWTALVRDVLPAADSLTLAQVRDEVPATLARLADALESSVASETRWLSSQAAGHGSERFHQGYNIEELMTEYRLLRRVIVEEVETALGRRTTLDEDLALSMGVDTVLQQGVVSFVNYQRDELHAAAEVESKFLRYLSHDLRGQLNHVTLVLHLLRGSLGKVPEFAAEVSEMQDLQGSIHETVEGMERILQAERLRKGDVPVKRSRVVLSELAEEKVRNFTRAAREKGLKLVSAVPAGATCESDRELLALVLRNLVGNAIKYSGSGTVTIGAAACGDGGGGGGGPTEDSWCLSVSDEGPGIAAEKVPFLFKEFVRGETHGQPGMGLGLAIASSAAKLLGTKLTLESVEGVGSTFKLTCPASR